MKNLGINVLLITWGLCAISSSGTAATFIVKNTGDAGNGSLRDAIEGANQTDESDIIQFDIPGSGPHSIQVTTPLPEIRFETVIDGTTQTGYSGSPVIEINGELSELEGVGLNLLGGNSIVSALAINGFAGYGILMRDLGGNRIERCFIGLDTTGTVAKPNRLGGVAMIDSGGNLVGGTDPGAGNIVSGNIGPGIFVTGESAQGNRIIGNWIGLNFFGNQAIGNQGSGILISQSPGTQVGSSEPRGGNVISGNFGSGIDIGASVETQIAGTGIQGNRIGSDPSGSFAIGNGNQGILIFGGTTSADVDALVEIVDNLIGYNFGNGVWAITVDGVQLRRNSFIDNWWLGFNLGIDGVTTNDLQDLDAGTNLGQNFPAITLASTQNGGPVRVEGILKSRPEGQYVIELYGNLQCDPSGFGEGAIMLNSITVQTDSQGSAGFSFELFDLLPGQRFFTATATDAKGNTSEFSPCVELNQSPAAIVGPFQYASEFNSPFLFSISSGATFLENFENGGLSLPGVSALGGQALGPGFNTDSVDGDDGFFDGSGRTGTSWLQPNGSAGVRFSFDETVLGGLPTHVGAVWTDGEGEVFLEAFDATGQSLGVVGPFTFFNNFQNGTADDHFTGISFFGGVSAIRFFSNGGLMELDHLQLGPVRRPGAPVILEQPVGRVATAGEEVTLQVVASGNEPLQYQWTWNGVNLPGATGSTIVIPSFGPEFSGFYNVSVANDVAAIDSEYVFLFADVNRLNMEDNFAQAPSLSTASFSGMGENLGATLEPGEPAHGDVGGASVWLTWTAPADGIATVNTLGSNFDTLLGVYTGPSVGNLQTIAIDDDSAGFLMSQIEFNARANEDYRIAVDGFQRASGAIILSLDFIATGETLPQIVRQPTPATVALNSPATFSVEAVGEDLSYQWLLDDVAIIGANEPMLSIPTVTPSEVGHYQVRVVQGNRTLTSSTAFLEIHIPAFGPPRPLTTTRKFGTLALQFEQEGALEALSLPGRVLPAAASIASGFSGAQIFSTFGSVKEIGEPNHCDVPGGASHWFAYRAQDHGLLTLSTEGSDFDTVLAIYSAGSEFSELLRVACDNDGGADGMDSRVTFPVSGETTYSIAVDGVGGATGRVNLNYELDAQPRIRSVTRLDGAILRVELSGPPNRTYRIEESSDLKTWSVLTTEEATTGLLELNANIDPSNSARFYRFGIIP